MAATLLQSVSANGSGVTSLSVTLGVTAGTVAPTPGSVIIAYVATTAAAVTCSASDAINGPYTTDAQGNAGPAICSVANTTSSNLAITGSKTGATAVMVMLIQEWTGITAPADKGINGGNWTTVTSFTTSSLPTLTQANELVVAAFGATANTGTVTAGTNFTQDAKSPVIQGANTLLGVEYQVVASTTGIPASMSWVNSTSGRTAVASYKITTDVTDSLTQQTATFAEGTIPPEVDYFPTQQTGVFAEGVLTPTGQDVNVTLGSQTIFTAEGAMPATGGDVTSQAGGSGKPRSRFKPKYAEDVFREEMAKLERYATEATEQRQQIEEKLSTSSPYEPDLKELARYVEEFEGALRRAQAREKRMQLPEVAVSFRIPAKSEGVKAIEAHARLQNLAKVARHRELVAQERLRKVRDRIDMEAATAFMNFILWDD